MIVLNLIPIFFSKHLGCTIAPYPKKPRKNTNKNMFFKTCSMFKCLNLIVKMANHIFGMNVVLHCI